MLYYSQGNDIITITEYLKLQKEKENESFDNGSYRV
jgi:hypothetical protein